MLMQEIITNCFNRDRVNITKISNKALMTFFGDAIKSIQLFIVFL